MNLGDRKITDFDTSQRCGASEQAKIDGNPQNHRRGRPSEMPVTQKRAIVSRAPASGESRANLESSIASLPRGCGELRHSLGRS